MIFNLYILFALVTLGFMQNSYATKDYNFIFDTWKTDKKNDSELKLYYSAYTQNEKINNSLGLIKIMRNGKLTRLKLTRKRILLYEHQEPSLEIHCVTYTPSSITSNQMSNNFFRNENSYQMRITSSKYDQKMWDNLPHKKIVFPYTIDSKEHIHTLQGFLKITTLPEILYLKKVNDDLIDVVFN